MRKASETTQEADSVLLTSKEKESLDAELVSQYEDLVTRLYELVDTPDNLPGCREFSFPAEDGSETQLTVVLRVYQGGEQHPRMIGAEWFMTDPSVDGGARTSLEDAFLSEKRIGSSNSLEQQKEMLRLTQSIEAVEELQPEK